MTQKDMLRICILHALVKAGGKRQAVCNSVPALTVSLFGYEKKGGWERSQTCSFVITGLIEEGFVVQHDKEVEITMDGCLYYARWAAKRLEGKTQ